MLQPHWVVRVSTLYSSKQASSQGRFTSVLNFTCLDTTSRRYHIGESLIPSARHFLRFIGAEEKVANHGFARKVRAYRWLL